MKICSSCGRVASTTKSACPACLVDYTELQESATLEGELQWGLFSGEFPCEGCGFPIPLNHLDLTGHLRCHNCGAIQEFPKSAWGNLLEAAHRALDFTGELRPDGNSSAWFQLSQTTSMKEYDEIRLCGTQQVEVHPISQAIPQAQITLSPGSPLCTTCNVPLQLEGLTRGKGTLSCPSCGEREVYTLPPGAENLGIALAHSPKHLERVEWITTTHPTPACPACDAALALPSSGTTTICPGCGRSVAFPSVALARLGDPDLTTPWWILFQGRSNAYRETQEVALKEPPSSPTEPAPEENQNPPEEAWRQRSPLEVPKNHSYLWSFLFLLLLALGGVAVAVRMGILDTIRSVATLGGEDDQNISERRPDTSRVRGTLELTTEAGMVTKILYQRCLYSRQEGTVLLIAPAKGGSSITLPLAPPKTVHLSLFHLRETWVHKGSPRGKATGCEELRYTIHNRARHTGGVQFGGVFSLNCTVVLHPLKDAGGKQERARLSGTLQFANCGE